MVTPGNSSGRLVLWFGPRHIHSVSFPDSLLSFRPFREGTWGTGFWGREACSSVDAASAPSAVLLVLVLFRRRRVSGLIQTPELSLKLSL